MLDNIKKFIDYFEKFFKRFKVIGYFIAIIFVIFYFIENGFEKKQALRLAEKITGLNMNNDILLDENKQLDSTLLLKDSLIAIKDFKIDSIGESEKRNARRAAYWKGEHGKIAETLIEITSDSSYNFTQKVWSFPGDKVYGYNAPQVKAMHRTYLENENKEEQIEALQATLFDCTSKEDLKNETMELTKSKLMIHKAKEDNLEKVIDNKDEEIELHKKAKRASFWKKAKPWITFGLGVIIGSL